MGRRPHKQEAWERSGCAGAGLSPHSQRSSGCCLPSSSQRVGRRGCQALPNVDPQPKGQQVAEQERGDEEQQQL